MSETQQTINAKIAKPRGRTNGSVTSGTVGPKTRASVTKSYFHYDQTTIRGLEKGTGIDRANNRYVQWVNMRDFEAHPERYDFFNVLRRKDVYGDENIKGLGMSKYSPESPLINNDLMAVWMPLDEYFELRKEIEAKNRAPVQDVLRKRPNQYFDREAQITVTHAEEVMETI